MMIGMNVSRLMRTRFLSFQADETMASAAKKMAQHRISEVPVLNGWKFAGMLRISDVAAAMVKPRLFQNPALRNAREVQKQTIGRHARARGVWLRPESGIPFLFLYLKRQNAEQAPVVDQQMRLIGVVYASDVSKELSKMLSNGLKAPIRGSAQGQEPERLGSQTPVDQLVHLIEKKGSIGVADAARQFGLSREEIQDYAKSLEKSNLIKIEYGLFGMRLVRPDRPGQEV
jgi:CBS domain-containing protein